MLAHIKIIVGIPNVGQDFVLPSIGIALTHDKGIMVRSCGQHSILTRAVSPSCDLENGDQ